MAQYLNKIAYAGIFAVLMAGCGTDDIKNIVSPPPDDSPKTKICVHNSARSPDGIVAIYLKPADQGSEETACDSDEWGESVYNSPDPVNPGTYTCPEVKECDISYDIRVDMRYPGNTGDASNMEYCPASGRDIFVACGMDTNVTIDTYNVH